RPDPLNVTVGPPPPHGVGSALAAGFGTRPVAIAVALAWAVAAPGFLGPARGALLLLGLLDELLDTRAETAPEAPLGPGAVALAGTRLRLEPRPLAGAARRVIFLGRALGHERGVGQQQPLADLPEAARDEVDAQPRGELVEDEGHEDHHVLHHLLL